MQDHPRYDAVGSSSLREELFNTFLKAQTSNATPPTELSADPSATKTSSQDDEQEKEKRLKAALEEAKRRNGHA